MPSVITLLFSLAASLNLWTLAQASSFTPVRRDAKVLAYTFDRETRHTGLSARHNQLRRRQSTQIAIDNVEIAYLMNITIGEPPQEFRVQLDTGSADLWVTSISSTACAEDSQGCQISGGYDKSKSSSYNLVSYQGFQIAYADGTQVKGDYVKETIFLGKSKLSSQVFASASITDRTLGVMGIGYLADESIASDNPSGTYPNVVQSLKDTGAIGTASYSLWLNDQDSNTGSILFGGVDTAKYSGTLTALPVQKNVKGAYTDFTVALSSFNFIDGNGRKTYEKSDINLPVVLDSGTSLTYLPENIANDVLKGVGAVNDPDLGPILPCKYANSPANFTFIFGGNGGAVITVSFGEFVNEIQLDDGSTPRFRDGSGDACSFGILSSGSPSDSEPQPILLGDTFLRSAYVVYDLENNQIAMAQTIFNTTESNIKEIDVNGIPGVVATATASAVAQSFTGYAIEPLAKTKKGGSTLTAAGSSATFALYGKGAGAVLSPPRFESMALITSAVLLVSMCLGSGLLLIKF